MKVILMMAITLDGKIGKTSDHLANWTSKADKKIFIQKTKEAGVMIMGRSTYDTIGQPLPKRLNIILTSQPEKFESIENVLEYTNASPKGLLKNLEERGYTTVMLIGGAKTNTAFLKEGLIDEMYITVEPKIFGSGLDLFSEISTDTNLILKSSEEIGENSVLLHYSIEK